MKNAKKTDEYIDDAVLADDPADEVSLIPNEANTNSVGDGVLVPSFITFFTSLNITFESTTMLVESMMGCYRSV